MLQKHSGKSGLMHNQSLQWLIAIILCVCTFTLLSISASPYHFKEQFPRFLLAVVIIIALLAACIAPSLEGMLSLRLISSFRYAMILVFASYISGYITFALSTLI